MTSSLPSRILGKGGVVHALVRARACCTTCCTNAISKRPLFNPGGCMIKKRIWRGMGSGRDLCSAWCARCCPKWLLFCCLRFCIYRFIRKCFLKLFRNFRPTLRLVLTGRDIKFGRISPTFSHMVMGSKSLVAPGCPKWLL